MDLVDLRGSLEQHIAHTTLSSGLVAKIQSFPSYQALRFDIQLTLYLAKIIETEIRDIKTPEEKKALVKQVLTEVFSLTPSEIPIIDQHMSYLIDTKKIKPISTFKYVTKSVGNWFAKKIL